MICQAAREQRMPLEYNLLGLRYQMEGHGRGYPSQPFWSYVQGKGNTIILGVDAHDPEHLRDTATWNTGLALAKATGMPLVDHLDLPD